MKNTDYRARLVDDRIDDLLSIAGAVVIEGAKWCGKTWTSRAHCQSEFLVGDPGNGFSNRELARTNATLILEGETPRLIDEWQEVPLLWDAVRSEVDRRTKKGQFILTGSATPIGNGIYHSGAGRMISVRMRPMSLFESGDSSGAVSLRAIMDGTATELLTGDVDLRNLIYLIVRGGWPGALGVSERMAGELPSAYINAVLERDLYKIDGVRHDRVKMEKLLRSLARNESTTATKSAILRDICEREGSAPDENTVTAYMDTLQRMFLIDNQEPFAKSIRSSARVKSLTKRHLVDPSIACALLNAGVDRLLGDMRTLGFLFEALCERDLRIYAESLGGRLSHYQDYADREVDAVVEMPDGSWGAFEIKLGSTQIDAATANLLRIKKVFENDRDAVPPKVLCVICGMSNAVYRRPDGVWVVPITALRN